MISIYNDWSMETKYFHNDKKLSHAFKNNKVDS